jgi:DNA-binding response OmpR family regulator
MNKTILAVDDDDVFLGELKEMIEKNSDYDVKTLKDPFMTEEYLDAYRPHALLLDILMPKRSGFNVIENLIKKEIHQDIPKAFVTCLNEESERLTAFACGVKWYITKPFKPEELMNCLDEMMA